jgi:hypothetical protein
MKRYKSDEWHTLDPDNWDFETRTYVDGDGKPITGILEDYFYFKKDDPRNHVYVKNGKRL